MNDLLVWCLLVSVVCTHPLPVVNFCYLHLPVSMDMGGTEGKTVMDESRINEDPFFCSLQQVTQVAQVPMTAPHTIARTVFIQHKHLAWAEPTLWIHFNITCHFMQHTSILFTMIHTKILLTEMNKSNITQACETYS